MLELAKSAMRLPFEGTKHATALLTGSTSIISHLSLSTLVEQMGPVLVNTAKGLSTPAGVINLLNDTAQRIGGALPFAWDPTTPLVSLVELRNKVEVFLLVLAVNDILDIPKTGPIDLKSLVDKAYGLDDYQALWAVEGLGHEYGDSFFRQGIIPQGILFEENTPYLPAKSLLMLHAGIGLSFAKTTFAKTTHKTPREEIRAQVRTIIHLCETNSRPGYLGPAYESLGLVTRTFNPDLLEIVDGILVQDAPHVRSFFWHGVGRALYFALDNWLPCSDPQIFQQISTEANDDESVHNGYAGASWAFLMVNQKNPDVLWDLLIKPFAARLNWNPGFANGIASSAIMRQNSTPGADFTASFADYQPVGCASALEQWNKLVATPYHRALQDFYPVLVAKNCLGKVFEFNDLNALVAGL